MTEKNRRSGKTVEHIVPAKEKREKRRAQDLLRRARDIDPNADEWDDFDFSPREHRFKKGQRLE